MTDFKTSLLKLNKNLNILKEREAKQGANAPLDLLNQIEDHEQAIDLTEQLIAGKITEAEWREALQPLNIDHTLIDNGFFQKVLRAISLPTDQQRNLRNRQIMLQRVHDFWVKGVLENSLHNEVLIELGMETKPEAVEYPWEMVIQRPDQPNRQLPPGTKIIDVFDESGGSLLILGEPGSGKTTMLLDLCRQLIVRTQADPTRSMPVILNLSSWSENRASITEWLVEELSNKYQIPQKITQLWVEHDALLLLLDGLDEIAPKHQAGCIEAINTFQQNSLSLFAACSRMQEYEALPVKLNLRAAISLRPLTIQQVKEYWFFQNIRKSPQI